MIGGVHLPATAAAEKQTREEIAARRGPPGTCAGACLQEVLNPVELLPADDCRVGVLPNNGPIRQRAGELRASIETVPGGAGIDRVPQHHPDGRAVKEAAASGADLLVVEPARDGREGLSGLDG